MDKDIRSIEPIENQEEQIETEDTKEIPEIMLEDIKPPLNKTQKQQVESVVTRFYAKMRSGPLPEPEEMGKYEIILPGSADRIIKMAEKEQDHRLKNAKKENDINCNVFGFTNIFGLLASFVYTICLFLLAVYFFWNGKEVSGWITLLTIGVPSAYNLIRDLSKKYSKSEIEKSEKK